MEGREGRDVVRAAVARLFIAAYAARSLAMRTCTAYVAITSSHLRRSRTRIFAIDRQKRVAARRRNASQSTVLVDQYQLQLGRDEPFSAAGADRSLSASLPRFVAAHYALYAGLGATRERVENGSAKEDSRCARARARAVSRRNYNRGGYTVSGLNVSATRRLLPHPQCEHR